MIPTTAFTGLIKDISSTHTSAFDASVFVQASFLFISSEILLQDTELSRVFLTQYAAFCKNVIFCAL